MTVVHEEDMPEYFVQHKASERPLVQVRLTAVLFNNPSYCIHVVIVNVFRVMKY